MAQKSILCIGYRGKTAHIASAKKAGIRVLLLTEASEVKKEYHEDFDNVFVVEDIFDWTEVYKTLRDVHFDGVMTRYEDFTVVCAAIADAFSLPGVRWENALNFRNKYFMRESFAEQNVPSADFVLISDLEQADEFLKEHSFPLILKQISGIHSKYVAKVRNRDEFERTFQYFQSSLKDGIDNLQKELKNFPRQIRTPSPCTHFLLEECLTGEELSIDAFVSAEKEIFFTPICKYVHSEEMGIDDQHLPLRIIEYDLPEDQKELILNVCKKSIIALGAEACVIHGEFFYDQKKGECRVIEVASRGGGARGEMIASARGIDYDLAAVKTALGETPDVTEKFYKYVSVGEVFSPENGILEGFDVAEIENRKNVELLQINRHVGQDVGRASDGCSHILKFLLIANSYEEAKNQSEEVLKNIQKTIRLRK